MARMIDADKFIEEMKTMWTDNCYVVELEDALPVVIKTVDEQPTAYDVEKVIEQLEEKTFYVELTDGGWDGYCVELEDAIEIVKAGGIDE